MDSPPNPVEEAAESVNPGDQGLPAPDRSESVRSESHGPAEPNEALLRISQDMARVLEILTAPKAPIDMVRRHGAEEFHGSNMEESDKAEFWLEKLQRIVEEVRCPPDQRVTCAVSLLQGGAYDWWKLVLRSPSLPDPIPWEFFVQEFRAKYVSNMYRETKWKQFLNLKQRNLSMAEYEKEFSHLSKYAPESVLTETFRCRQFEDGLNESIKRYLAPVTVLQQVNFYQLVQAAMKVEKSEASSRERFQKRQFSRGASSSSGKRARESQDVILQGSATRGRRQGSTVISSSGRGVSTGQGEVPECSHCHKRHLGMCRLLTRGCFICGSTEHWMANCPRELGDNRSLQGSGRGRYVAPPSTRDRGRGRGGSIQQRGRGSTVSETVDRPMPTAPARAYAMKAREDQNATEIITGIFSLYDIEMHALIDPGSTHSYICSEYVFDRMPSVEQLPYDMLVTSPLGHSVRVNRVYKNCHLMTHDREFSADLLALPFHEFDLILGMDWLSKHRAIVDCDKKTVRLKCSDMSEVIIHGIQSGAVSNVISATQARRLLRKGCEAFLAMVLDSKRGQI